MEIDKRVSDSSAPAPDPAGPSPVTDVALRVLLLAASIVAVVVMVTSKQTEMVPVAPTVAIPVPAKFQNSPAFIYFVAALSVAGLYSLLTLIASLSMRKSIVPAKFILFLVAYDVVMLGLVATAVGTAGGVAYVGLKGNKHVQWNKICNVYDKFCRHAGSSIAVALFACFVLVFLVIINSYSLYTRIPHSSRTA